MSKVETLVSNWQHTPVKLAGTSLTTISAIRHLVDFASEIKHKAILIRLPNVFEEGIHAHD